MRKLFIIAVAAAVLVPSMASAHTTRGELRRDRHAVAEERHEYRRALVYGSPRKVHEERRELLAAKREYRRDKRAFVRHKYRRWH